MNHAKVDDCSKAQADGDTNSQAHSAMGNNFKALTDIDVKLAIEKQARIISAVLLFGISLVVMILWCSYHSSVTSIDVKHLDDSFHAMQHTLLSRMTQLSEAVDALKGKQDNMQEAVDELYAKFDASRQNDDVTQEQLKTSFTGIAALQLKHSTSLERLNNVLDEMTNTMTTNQDDVTAQLDELYTNDKQNSMALEELSELLELQNDDITKVKSDTTTLLRLVIATALNVPISGLFDSAEAASPVDNSYTAALHRTWYRQTEKQLQSSTPTSIRVINDQLWICGGQSGIEIYDADLTFHRAVSSPGMGVQSVNDVAEMDNGDVIVAASDGLYHFDKTSKF